MDYIAILNAELAAIDRRDRLYWRMENPELYERLEYLVRQDRRRVLMTELFELMQRNGKQRGTAEECDRMSP